MLRFSSALLCLALSCACGAPERATAPPRADEGSEGAEASATSEASTREATSSADARGEGAVAAVEIDEAEIDEAAEGDEVEVEDAAPNPDSISSTPSHATFTRCEPEPSADCEDCGVRVALRRRRGWRAAEYAFEILTEGNHIRCAVTLPCDDAAPVACQASPGAPQVVVETSGCDAGDGELAALRFEPVACPAEMRIESYRDGIRAGVQDLRPRYRDGRATATHALER